MNMPGSVLLAIISCVGVASNASQPQSNQFTLVSWNVDASGADPQLIALRMSRFEGVHLWGLCEVRDSRCAEMFVQAAGENEPGDFVGILSRTGGSDQSCIIYDTTRFELVRSFEIDCKDRLWYYPGMTVRPPLVAHLRHRDTGQEFYFMVNRLYGCRTDKQSADLNAWASARTIPVVAAGTYDFQYDPGSGPLCPDGQKALLALIANGILRWLAPENPIATFNWDRDVIDDFIFLAHTLGKMRGQSWVVVEPGDFSNSEMNSDHRPIQAVFTVGSNGVPRSAGTSTEHLPGSQTP